MSALSEKSSAKLELSRVWSTNTVDLENKHNRDNKITAFGTLFLAFKTFGVVYGDIGTSPLYVFSGIFPEPPKDPRDVYGAVCLIVWSLTLIPLIKYVGIVIRADDKGEGGTFALYGLLARHCGIVFRGENRQDDLSIVNYDVAPVRHNNKSEDGFIARSKTMQKILFGLALSAAALVLSDGVLTPAISVISAVEGLEIPFPDLTNVVVPVACIIIVILCLGQRFGTDKIGVVFAPIILMWMFSLFSVGIWNIRVHPDILKAYNPQYAIEYFQRNGRVAFDALGGVLLAITGVEAMFADMGHFNRNAIRIAFGFVVYPSLVLAYLGQGARLVKDPSVASMTFWRTIPESSGIYWTIYVLAILATIIASQAMISATFTLLSQAMRLDCFPNVKVVHTSRKHRLQIYIPEVNYIVMVIVVIVCIGFQESARLTVAYGVSVVSVMFISTCFISIVIHTVWKLHIVFSVLFFLLFGFFDIMFLSSTLQKVRDGGWFTLTLAALVGCIMIIWYWGTSLRVAYEIENKQRIRDLFIRERSERKDKTDDEALASSSSADENTDTRGTAIHPRNTQSNKLRFLGSGLEVPRLPGIGLFYQDAGLGVPIAFSHFIQHMPAAPAILIFISVRTVAVPSVGDEDRLVVERVGNFEGVYRVIARYGYIEQVSQSDAFIARLIDAIKRIDARTRDSSQMPSYDSEKPAVTYFFGRQTIRAGLHNSIIRHAALKTFQFFQTVSRDTFSNWDIPLGDIIEVGQAIPL